MGEMVYADKPGFYNRIIVNDDLEKAYAALCDFLQLGKKASYKEEIRKNVQRRAEASMVQEDVRGEISAMLSRRVAGGGGGWVGQLKKWPVKNSAVCHGHGGGWVN